MSAGTRSCRAEKDNIKPIKKRTNSTRGDTDQYHLEFTANSEINRRDSGPMNGGGATCGFEVEMSPSALPGTAAPATH
jgi:hypothetical protein